MAHPRVSPLSAVRSLYCALQAIKECMILGFISFVLFILKDQAVVDQSDEVFANTFDVRRWKMTDDMISSSQTSVMM